jgi:23S rRNA (cytidine1920-2'-O)/16S rRNA (cytidine1409-2'-O)-methyltransferase
MVRRGLASTRSEADLVIRSGKVVVDGRPATNAARLVLAEEPIAIGPPGRRFVSRGGEKLEAALEGFGIDVRGRSALDAGASTGGFTDCLLSRGAARVLAVDVGYGQLDWRLREDPRVAVMERTNVRELGPGDLPWVPDLVVADLSFISLRAVLAPLAARAAEAADLVLLVKPQFEAARGDAPGGVVVDPEVWRGAVEAVARAAADEGLGPRAVMASPLLGPKGNAEFLLWVVKGAPEGLDQAAVGDAVARASDLRGPADG